MSKLTANGTSVLMLIIFVKRCDRSLVHYQGYIWTYVRVIFTKTAFFTSQFNCCPLAWVYHKRNKKNRVDSLHERIIYGLRIIYGHKNSTSEELLESKNLDYY